MQTFKKFLLSVIAFLCIFSLFSGFLMGPYLYYDAEFYDDSGLRASLAGKIDWIILGASHALTAFDPAILDEELDCFSYNLSNSLMTTRGKYHLLKKELERNPVETVVLEVSYDTFTRELRDEYGDGDAKVIQRLDSLPEALGYLVNSVSINDWLNIYSRFLVSGTSYWQFVLRGQTNSRVDPAAKGYYAHEIRDVSISMDAAQAEFNSKPIKTNFNTDYVRETTETIAMCKENGVRVILVVVPIADMQIWQADNWDVFHDWMQEYAVQQDCEFYDFNLIHDRYARFSDERSFYDSGHMSTDGATSLSNLFVEILHKVNNGEDVSGEFYDSYESMKQESPYHAYLK